MKTFEKIMAAVYACLWLAIFYAAYNFESPLAKKPHDTKTRLAQWQPKKGGHK